MTYGFPSFPNITPLGYFLGGTTALAVGVFVVSSCVSSAIFAFMIRRKEGKGLNGRCTKFGKCTKMSRSINN